MKPPHDADDRIGEGGRSSVIGEIGETQTRTKVGISGRAVIMTQTRLTSKSKSDVY